MDVHTFFDLTYANYLVLHRTFMQSMPMEWQYAMTSLLRELQEAFDHVEQPYGFRVQAVDSGNRFAKDPVPHYNRGRTRIIPWATLASGSSASDADG